MKTTRYFDAMRLRPDRKSILDAYIALAAAAPERHEVQADGRIKRWRRIDDAGGRWLRVVVLADGEAVHNAFFDRGFRA